jgi:signal transduction histidine kinase
VEESRRRQTEFIAAASHELKSPLSVIRANASASLIEPQRAEHFIEGIDKECERLSNLIEDMLLLASADANNWKVNKEIIDMDTLLIDTYDTFCPFCSEHGKELRLELQEEMLPSVEGDAIRIKQILAILIDNAVCYSKERDSIIIRTFVIKNHLYIEIEDHGTGIDQNKKLEVFERFYREDKSRKDKNHFGLGLSIAKELVELQEGSISVKDTSGGGATFSVCFPVN